MYWIVQFCLTHSLKNLQFFFKNNLRVLDCTFNVQNNLKERLDQLSSEAEIAVREGCKHLILSDKTSYS